MFPEYRRIIAEQQAQAKATGKSVQRTFNKAQFLKQFPEAEADPRFKLLPDSFILDMTPLEEISVKELRELCLKKEKLPLSQVKRLSILGLPENTIVFVPQNELDELRKDETPIVSAPPTTTKPPESTTLSTKPSSEKSETPKSAGKKTK